MIILKLFRLVKGYVFFHASGGYFERFLNLISSQNINLWGMESTPEEVRAFAFAGDYKKLAVQAKKCGVRIRVKKRFGLPFLAKKYKKRLGMIIGLFLFAILILFMQNFVWTLDVVGNEKNSTERVLHVLEEHGLRPGAFLPSLNLREIQNEVVLELDDISWFAINNYGSRIVVEMKEAEEPPEILDEETPCNVVALKAGVIKYTEIYSGQPVVEVGSVVAKGDLLVSGVMDHSSDSLRFVHARGKIYAETYFDETFEVTKQETIRTENGKYFERNYLNLFGLKLPLFIALPVNEEYQISSQYSPWSVFGVELPMGIEKLCYVGYESESVTYTKETAEQRLNEILQSYQDTQLDGVEIRQVTPELIELEDRFQLKVSFVCYEDIALEEMMFSS